MAFCYGEFVVLQYVAFGRNLTAVVLRDLEIANVVDRVRTQ